MRSARIFSAFILMMTLFFVVGNSAQAYSEIKTDTVWHLSDSPIILSQSLFVWPGAKLTIEPGVVVKMPSTDIYNMSMMIQGELSAVGTVDNPIIFTSIKDDAVGGDSNGDGGYIQPKAGDWRQLSFQNGGKGVLNNVIIRYGGNSGGAVIENSRSDLQIINSIITLNGAAIYNNEGNLTISNSAIYDNAVGSSYYAGAHALQNSGRVGYVKTVQAQNNWWGTAAGPCDYSSLVSTSTPPWQINWAFVCGSKPPISSKVIYEPWLTEFPEFKTGLDPVILIPGILGSYFRPTTGQWELDPVLNTYYDLYEALKANGYEEGKNLFAFPYQWRQSNVVTALQLRDKINEVKAICHCDKVDLVAHSMGGLVARQYIENSDYQNDVDQLIFLATPHRGAPKAYLMWEGGESGITFDDLIMESIFGLEAFEHGYIGDEAIFNYLRDYNIDSTWQLLPDYYYLRDKDSGQFRTYTDGYPANPFLELLNASSSLAKLSAVNILNILGNTGSETVTALRVYPVSSSAITTVLWPHGQPDGYYWPWGDRGLEYGEGDGTVPKDSNDNFLGARQIVINNDHRQMVSDSQGEVIKELTGKEPAVEIKTNTIDTILLFKIFSPADFQIIAPNGQRLGRDFNSNGILEEIPGGYYSGFDGDSEYAIISNPMAGEYRAQFIGTGIGGKYRFSVSEITDATSTIEQNYYGAILADQRQDLILDYATSGLAVAWGAKVTTTIEEVKEKINGLYEHGEILGKNNRKWLVEKYNNLKSDVKKIDSALRKIDNVCAKDDHDEEHSEKDSEKTCQKDGKTTGYSDDEDDNVSCHRNKRTDHGSDREKLLADRQDLIDASIDAINQFLDKLLLDRLISVAGYDIIKSNNNYLKYDWHYE